MRAAVPTLLALVALSAGCIGISGPADLELAVARGSGARLDRVVGLDVGGFLAGAALSVASTEAGLDLDEGRIDRVEVGVYELSARDGLVEGTSLFDGLTIPGWTACVKVRDRREEVRVFLQPKGETLSGVAVLVRDGDEVVIVRVKGDLAPIAEQAIRFALEHEEAFSSKDEMMSVAAWR
ncbi:MAG: DUF4252 domain-containing protein [Acidobacteriota bacterium]|nr:DUF4252 domain-containing protein [Acidobacteriota bacterium]